MKLEAVNYTNSLKLLQTIKGSSTYLQMDANLHQEFSSDGFWPQKNTCEDLAPSTSQFRNKKQKCSLDFLLFSFVFVRHLPDALRENLFIFQENFAIVP